MLGKLLKYDIKSLYRTFLPLWGVILVLAGITRLMDGLPAQRQSLGDIFDAQDIALIVLVSVIIAVSVIAAVLVVQWFYKGLLRDEGYLMFTLPVTSWKLVLSKLLSAVSVFYISSLVGVLTILILLGGIELDIFMNILMQSEETAFFRDLLWYMVPALLLTPFAVILHAYLAMALGHLAKKHRIAVSIGAYLGINMLVNIISTQLMGIFNFSADTTVLTSIEAMIPAFQNILTFSLCFSFLEILAFFALTVLILNSLLLIW